MSSSFIKLLFFDTFTHERNEDLNIDLVKFSGHPVVVREIRIVPNNSCVPIEPSIYSQGFTLPSSFALEIFANNLSRTAACTFEKLCSFDYRADKEIRLVPSLLIATDGLLIRGFYQVITLAIYGEPAPDEPTPPPYPSVQMPSGIPSTISPTQTRMRMPLMTSSVTQSPGSSSVAPWSAPSAPVTPWPSQMPCGVALFNPSVPPPIPIQTNTGPVGGPPFQSNNAPQQIPTLVPRSAMVSNAYGIDVSRPPPCFPPEHNKPSKVYEGQPIETIGTVKPFPGAPIHHQSFLPTVREREEGEYDNSDDDNDEKFNFETISDDEFDLDDSAGDVDYAELQEDLLKETRFNVYRFELRTLIHFKPPHLSQFELEKSEMEENFLNDETPVYVKEFLNAVVEFDRERNEKWVVFVESLMPNLIPTVIIIQEKMKNFDPFCHIIDWTMDGLNINLALKQEQAAFIIRHLKVGLKLASILVSFESPIAEKLLDLRLQHILIDLLNAEHMSLPLKLQILKTLDSTLFFPVGFRSMISQVSETNEKNQNCTPYQRLAASIMGKTSSRMLVAVKALMKKIHFYRLLASFSNLVNNLANNAEPLNANHRNSSSVSDVSLDDDEVAEIADSLHEILQLYVNAKHILVQPPYCVPASVVFEASKSSEDPFPSIFQYFINENFLASLLLLLTCRRSNEETRILTAVCQMLNELLSSNAGVLFLYHQGDVTRELLRFSLQHNDDGHDDETIILQQLGVDVAYCLQALHLIDEMMHYHSSGVVQLEVDNPGVLSTLQSFYVLTFDQSNDNRGRRAVVRVLSYENNLNSILPFVELTNDEQWDNKIKKSACAGYATELLLLVLRLSDSVELLKNYGDKLLAISCEDAGSKISDVKNWTEILRKLPSFTYESVEYLCEKIKNFFQQDGVVPKIPKGLVTTLRILKYLIVPPDVDDSCERMEELKYKYSLLQILSNDTLTTLVQIIDKLAEAQIINWQQGISLNSLHGSLFFSCVLPTLSLIRTSLSYLAHCRGSEYQDVTAILPLMKLYSVCCSMLPSTGVVAESTSVQKEIVATILAYTQPDVFEKTNEFKDDSFEVVNKSLWTRAVNELLKFTTDSPYTFVAGLSVLSELLPLPLPVQTKESLTPTETHAIESKRRLWSVHLMPLASQLQQLVKDLTPTTHTNLQQNLRRVCVQLSDLSPAIAIIVVKALLNVVLENAEIVETSPEKELTDGQPTIVRRLRLPATSGLAFALNLVSYLSSTGPFKVVMIDLLRSRPETVDQIDQEGFSPLLSYFLDIFNHVSSERSHQLCQEHIVSILQSLCDEDIGLLPGEKSMTYEQISCSTPEPQQLRHICVALLNHIGCPDQSYATVLPTLRIFVMLCEHDYGLYHIKKALEVETKALLSMFQRLLFEFSGHSSDCLSTLSTFLELMKLLQLPSDEFKSEVRKCFIGVEFIREILEWKYGECTNDDHPLKKLCRLLETSAKEDDALTSLFSNVQKLVSVLSDPTSVESDEFVEPPLPPPLDVRVQFNQRHVWTLTNDDDEDRLTAHYWFPVYTLESEDGDVEKVECDLEAIRLQYFPTFDVIEELKRKFSSKRPDDTSDSIRKNTGVIDTSGKHKKRFIAPLRGRPRTGNMGGYGNRLSTNRPNDAFRNRPPNTSRPPSMHVDDFIIAECQSVAPPVVEMEKASAGPSPKVAKDSSSGRNRPMDRMQPKSVRPRPPSPHSNRNRPYLKPVMSSARSFNKGHMRSSMHDRQSDRNGRKSRSKHSVHRSSSRRKTPK